MQVDRRQPHGAVRREEERRGEERARARRQESKRGTGEADERRMPRHLSELKLGLLERCVYVLLLQRRALAGGLERTRCYHRHKDGRRPAEQTRAAKPAAWAVPCVRMSAAERCCGDNRKTDSRCRPCRPCRSPIVSLPTRCSCLLSALSPIVPVLPCLLGSPLHPVPSRTARAQPRRSARC